MTKTDVFSIRTITDAFLIRVILIVAISITFSLSAYSQGRNDGRWNSEDSKTVEETIKTELQNLTEYLSTLYPDREDPVEKAFLVSQYLEAGSQVDEIQRYLEREDYLKARQGLSKVSSIIQILESGKERKPFISDVNAGSDGYGSYRISGIVGNPPEKRFALRCTLKNADGGILRIYSTILEGDAESDEGKLESIPFSFSLPGLAFREGVNPKLDFAVIE